MIARIYIVMLRRPHKNDPRTDPFWEFGSFGCTGCHSKNLLHPEHCQVSDGDKLAFIQGGHLGSRLLLVTPPVTRIIHPGGGAKGRLELRWDPRRKPFRYERAPPLFGSARPGRPGLFPRLAEFVSGTDRSTVDAKLASRFRARSRPLEASLADELETVFNLAEKSAKATDFITEYADALPWCDCPASPSERRRNYRERLKLLQQSTVTARQPRRCCK